MALRDVKEITVPVMLDRPRTIKYDLNAFADLEDIYGTMGKVFEALQTGSMKAARTLLWAGLLHEDETLTQRQVGGMVTMENLEAVMDTISSALLEAMPQANAGQEVAPVDPT